METLVFISKLKWKLCSCSNSSFFQSQPALLRNLKNSSDIYLKISMPWFVILLLLLDFHPNYCYLSEVLR